MLKSVCCPTQEDDCKLKHDSGSGPRRNDESDLKLSIIGGLVPDACLWFGPQCFNQYFL